MASRRANSQQSMCVAAAPPRRATAPRAPNLPPAVRNELAYNLRGGMGVGVESCTSWTRSQKRRVPGDFWPTRPKTGNQLGHFECRSGKLPEPTWGASFDRNYLPPNSPLEHVVLGSLATCHNSVSFQPHGAPPPSPHKPRHSASAPVCRFNAVQEVVELCRGAFGVLANFGTAPCVSQWIKIAHILRDGGSDDSLCIAGPLQRAAPQSRHVSCGRGARWGGVSP